MKKFFTLVLSLFLVLSMAACGKPQTSEFEGGTFEGTAKGFGGDVVAKVLSP